MRSPRPYAVGLMALLLVSVAATGLRSQSRDLLKARAESALSQMTPDEFERRLKELGISLDEATRRAEELNISLEDFLKRAQPPTKSVPSAPTAVVSDTVRLLFPPQQVTTPAARRESLGPVPGFEGRTGPADLKPFGFEIFRGVPTTFEPVLNVPTPAGYQIGPGDELVVSVWGETKLAYQLIVNREGNVVVPDVGPVSANGLTILQFRERLLRRMTAVYSGLQNGAPGANTFLDVSLGKLRTIQVFVLGEVENPGGYSVSSMSTAFHALYLSGGPAITGSLREIRVMRGGELLAEVDLYDYLLKGDKSKDPRLQDGDIVLVRPAKRRVAVRGQVVRPFVYEIREKEVLADLIQLAGGLRFDAYHDRVHVERVIPFRERQEPGKTIRDIDLRFASVEELLKSRFAHEDGDVVTVAKISEGMLNRVSITGNVRKPGVYQLKPGMTVRDLILEADSLDRNTFTERATLLRLLPNLRRELLQFSPRLALSADSVQNLALQNEDSVIVYKESQFFPEHTVSVWGAVRNPGTYPRNELMSLAQLVVLAGGLREDASLTRWQISRIETSEVALFSRTFIVDVGEAYWEDERALGFLLEDFDVVSIPTNPGYSPPRVVRVDGFVMYPGAFSVRFKGEKLTDVLERAGGLRPGAYLEGARFYRTRDGGGLIPVDFSKALSDRGSLDNIELFDGDSIHVPEREDVVYVRGEVFTPGGVLYERGASLSHYLKQAGGTRDEADEGRVFVTLPNGQKWESGGWFLPDPDILPGSVVYVPTKIEKEDKTLPVLRDMATILASLAAITVAMVQVWR